MALVACAACRQPFYASCHDATCIDATCRDCEYGGEDADKGRRPGDDTPDAPGPGDRP